MRIARWRTAAPRTTRFEGIREFAVVPAGQSANHCEALASADVQCRRGEPVRKASDCLRCARIVNFRPGPGHAITMRCLWCDDDRVDALMTPASAVVTIHPAALIAEAEAAAAAAEARHLVVADREGVLGVLCRCDLVAPIRPDETVGDRMSDPPWGVHHGATLGEAVTVMREKHIGILLVVRSSELAGVLSRGDLRRAGVPEELLGAEYCVVCGSAHGVIEHARVGDLPMCLECCELASECRDEDELGGGD